MEIISQRPHASGAQEPRSFEDSLREMLASSPYLGLSLGLHVVLLLLLATAPDAPALDPERTIVASPEPPAEPPPPPPPPDEPPPIEPPEEPVETPQIIEDVVPVDVPVSTAPVVEGREDPGDLGLIGLGGGGPTPGTGRGIPPHRATREGPPLIIRSIDQALDWLARHQAEDGSWSCAGFDASCRQQPPCDGLGSPQYDVGVTGLALLAFLGAGNTHESGRYRQTVRRGLRYLTDVQGPDGNFGNALYGRHTYDHVLATLALVEAYALTGSRLFRGPAEDGLAHLYAIRNPGAAWRYAPFHPEMASTGNDMSVTGWAIMAMAEARDCGLPVDPVALEDAWLYLEEMTDPETGVTGYYDRGGRPARESGVMEQRWPHEQSESMTAVGVLCRIFADRELARPGNREAVEKGVAVIARLPPVWDDERPGRRDFYFWYYGSTALYQYGGKAWEDWQVRLLPAIAEQQRSEGEARGSWDPQHDPWGNQGGRIYATAILTLTLEAYFRFPSALGAH
jgi:hypothetical protein